jgi:hypothetical protein
VPKEKQLTIEEVLNYCHNADRTSLLQINSAIVKHLKGNGGNGSGITDSMVISKGEKTITIDGRPGSIARKVAGLLFGDGVNDESINPALAFCSRQTAAFTAKKEFDRVVNALLDKGYKIEKFPEGIKEKD